MRDKFGDCSIMYTSSSAVGGGAVGGAVGGAAGSLCYTEKPSSCEAFERRGYSTGVEFSGAPTSCSTHRSNVYFLPHQDISRCNSGIRIDTLCYTEPNALAFRGSVAHAASPGVIAQESRAPLQLSKTQCSQEPSQNTLPTSPSSEVQRKQSVTSWSTELVLSERAAVPSSLQQTRTPSPSSASSNRKALVRLRTLHWSAAGTPVASRWSRVSPQMRPWYTPSWVKEMQCKLPWYSATERAGGGPWLSWRASEVPYQFVKEEFLCRWRSWGDRCFLLFRALAVFLLILVLFLINVYPGMDLYDIKKVPQIYDLLQEWTAKLNCSIAELPIKGSVMIFIASLMMDAMVLVAWFQWIIIGDSFRLPIAYTLLYGIRGLMRIFSLLPYPDHYIWEAPDFKGVVIPSLTVPVRINSCSSFSLPVIRRVFRRLLSSEISH